MQSALQIRRITQTDLAYCAAIDQHAVAAGTAWKVQDFRCFLSIDWDGAFVALWQGSIIGFLLYDADRRHRILHVIRICVAPSWQRRRVGSCLVQFIRRWLSPMPDVPVWMMVHERDLTMQCFLRANGFRATSIERGHYGDADNDGYLFEAKAAEHLPAARGLA